MVGSFKNQSLIKISSFSCFSAYKREGQGKKAPYQAALLKRLVYGLIPNIYTHTYLDHPPWLYIFVHLVQQLPRLNRPSYFRDHLHRQDFVQFVWWHRLHLDATAIKSILEEKQNKYQAETKLCVFFVFFLDTPTVATP